MIVLSRITFYVLIGVMANGEQTHKGAVACSWDIPLETVVTIIDDQYICKDRGILGNGNPYSWVDIWAESYEEGQRLIHKYGELSQIQIGVIDYGRFNSRGESCADRERDSTRDGSSRNAEDGPAGNRQADELNGDVPRIDDGYSRANGKTARDRPFLLRT